MQEQKQHESINILRDLKNLNKKKKHASDDFDLENPF